MRVCSGIRSIKVLVVGMTGRGTWMRGEGG